MFRNILCAGLASTALAAAPVLAAPGGAHGPPAGVPGGNAGAHVGVGVMTPNAGMGVDMRAQGRLNSQGPNHASATGIAHASSNSVLKSGAVISGPLAGLAVGTSVQMNGDNIGSVQRIVTSSNGIVRRVLVTGTDGRLYSLSPSTLTLSGGVLTTTRIRGH